MFTMLQIPPKIDPNVLLLERIKQQHFMSSYLIECLQLVMLGGGGASRDSLIALQNNKNNVHFILNPKSKQITQAPLLQIDFKKTLPPSFKYGPMLC